MKTKLNFCLAIIFSLSVFFGSWESRATPSSEPSLSPLIYATGVSEIEYQAVIESEERYQSFESHFEQQTRQAPLTETLISSYTRAKEALFRKQHKIAQDRFRQIFEIRHGHDWSRHHREIIFDSIVTLASFAISQNEREQIFDEAIAFDPDLTPTQMTPSLRTEFQQRRQQMMESAFDLDLQPFVSAGLTLYLNGRKLVSPLMAVVKIPRGKVRVTLVSNSDLVRTEQVQSEHLAQLVVRREFSVAGECARPIWGTKTPHYGVSVLFGQGCIRHWSGREWLEGSAPTPKLSLKELLPASAATPNRNSWPQERQPSESVFKKPWFWAAVAVGAGVLIYSLQRQESQRSAAPRHTVNRF